MKFIAKFDFKNKSFIDIKFFYDKKELCKDLRKLWMTQDS